MYGKMKKKKEGNSISKGMMENYTTVPKEVVESEKRLMKSEEEFMKKYMAGGKVGRGCGAAIRGGGAVMKKSK